MMKGSMVTKNSVCEAGCSFSEDEEDSGNVKFLSLLNFLSLTLPPSKGTLSSNPSILSCSTDGEDQP